MRDALLAVVADLIDERHRQDARWGEQNHEDGTGGSIFVHESIEQRARTSFLAENGAVRWCDILLEEVYEALAEEDVEADVGLTAHDSDDVAWLDD